MDWNSLLRTPMIRRQTSTATKPGLMSSKVARMALKVLMRASTRAPRQLNGWRGAV